MAESGHPSHPSPQFSPSGAGAAGASTIVSIGNHGATKVRGFSLLFLQDIVMQNISIEKEWTVSDFTKRIITVIGDKQCAFIDLYENHSSPYAHVAQPYLGDANTFVCYSRGNNFSDLLQVLVKHALPDTFFYFDVMCLNLKNGPSSLEDFAQTQRAIIQYMRKILVLISPWKMPLVLKRVFCLWELREIGNREWDFLIPQREFPDFCQAVEKEPMILFEVMSRWIGGISSEDNDFFHVMVVFCQKFREWCVSTLKNFFDGSNGNFSFMKKVGRTLSLFGNHEEGLFYFGKAVALYLMNGLRHSFVLGKYVHIGNFSIRKYLLMFKIIVI